jgi:cobalt/nickel transport system permease protein
MRDRAALFAYAAAVVSVTLIHDLAALAVGLGVLFVIAGGSAVKSAKRAALSVVFFNSVVTLSYLVMAHWRGGASGYFVALINLRVFLLAYMTLVVVDRVNLLRALSFSKPMQYLFTITYGQTMVFRRLYEDFRMALKSRTIGRLSARDLYRHGAWTSAYLLRKAMNDSTEIARAMNSRGFFRA